MAIRHVITAILMVIAIGFFLSRLSPAHGFAADGMWAGGHELGCSCVGTWQWLRCTSES